MTPEAAARLRTRICPYCLSPAYGSESCASCGQELPLVFTQSGGSPRVLPMPTLGWPGHGRSTYLTALSYLLTRLNLLWANCTHRELGEPTREFLMVARRLCQTGELPPRTPGDPQPRLLLLLKSLGRWGDFVLALEDSAGHHFSGAAMTPSQAPFLIRSPCALMMISPVDLAKSDWRMVDMLLNTYLEAIELNGLEPSKPRRGLVIVLTKADLFFDHLPQRLQELLKGGGLDSLLRPRKMLFTDRSPERGPAVGDQALEQNLAEMKEIDRELRQWLGQDPQFRNLQLKAEQCQLEIRYSLVSATGEPVPEKTNALPNLWRPRRVLEPFLWLLQLEAQLGGTAPFIAELEKRQKLQQDFSLELTNRRTLARTRANLHNRAGSLEPVSKELADFAFEVGTRGVVFKSALPRTLSVVQAGSRNARKGERFPLEPGDVLQIGDWDIRLCAGFFQPDP